MTDATPELNKALAAVQGRLPKIGKGEEGKVSGTSKSGKPYEYTYRYADLSGISPIILPLLGEEGLSWMCRPTQEDGQFFLLYELRHQSGEVVGGRYPLHFAGGPQEVGKEITYARRYTLCAVTGIAPGDDDDDGASAQQAVTRQGRQRSKAERDPNMPPQQDKITSQQTTKLKILLGELHMDRDAGLEFARRVVGRGITTSQQLTKREASAVIDALLVAQKEGVQPNTGEVVDADVVEEKQAELPHDSTYQDLREDQAFPP